MSKLSKRFIASCVIVLVALVSVLTITLRKDRHQVVEEILTAKAPELAGDTRLKQLSAVIAEEIEKTDEHRQDRVNDLLVAMEESESLQSLESIGELDKLNFELARENLKSLTKWFLSTDPPSPEQRRQIKGQIDEIVTFTKDIALEIFPKLEAEVEESVNNLRHNLMWEYNDPLNPTLKRPLSEVEIKAIRAELVEVQNQILNRAPGVPANLENRLSPSDANQYIANQQYIWSQSAFPRLFVTPLSAIEVYKLPPTKKMTQLGNVLREEFIQRAQAEAERSFREEDIEVQKLFEKQRKELAARDAQERAQRKRFDDQIRTQVAAATYTIELLIEEQKYEPAIEATITLLEQIAAAGEYGTERAAFTASGFATQFIKHGQIDLAQNILDKYVLYFVQYCVEANQDLFQQALEKFRSHYFHGIKLFDYISQNATEEAIKARCQFAIACCSDMIARESMDASIWYKTDDEKEDAVAETLKRYETFAETYPKSRYASWAYHFSWFLAAYPPKLGRPQNTTAPLELIEQQASEIMSDVREILRSHRPQWADTQIDTYTKNVQSALKGTLYRILTPAEYDNFRNSFRTYCERALPEQLNNVDALAIELITIRWAVRQYVARLDLASELAKAAVDWQVEQIIKGFDQFVATYLYDKSLESEVSSVKKEFREAVDLYRKNVLYPIFKAPLSPRELWRYERFVLYQEERMEAYIAVAEIFNSQKRRELSSSVQLWVENISHAHKMLFQDEFHPADPTKNRIIEYRYLPNKGIKMTLPVDKEDYPKLGLN